jgi:hypothetical protein
MFWVEKVAEARLKEKTLVLAKRLWAHAIFLDFEQSVIKKCLGFLSIFIEKIGLNQGRLLKIWVNYSFLERATWMLFKPKSLREQPLARL